MQGRRTLEDEIVWIEVFHEDGIAGADRLGAHQASPDRPDPGPARHERDEKDEKKDGHSELPRGLERFGPVDEVSVPP